MRAEDVMRVPCHRCGATEGSMCRSLGRGRYTHVDGFHKARREAAARLSETDATPSASSPQEASDG